MKNNLQVISAELLKLSEDQVIKSRFRIKKLDFLLRNFLYPGYFIYTGVGLFFKNFKNFYWILFITIVVLFSSFLVLNPSSGNYESLIAPAFFISILIVAFAVPSSLSEIVVCVETVESIKQLLIKHDINSIDKIEMIEKTISFNKELLDRRVHFFKWVVGFVWAAYLLYLNFEIKLMGLSEDYDFQIWSSNLNFNLLVIITISLVFSVLIASYSKTCDIIYKNIEFSFNQYKFELTGNDAT